MMHFFFPKKKGLFLSEPFTSTLRVAGLRCCGQGATSTPGPRPGCTGSVPSQQGGAQPQHTTQPRLIYDTGYNDQLQPRRNSQQFPPSVDTGFQHWLFLLPTSIFIQLVQNQGCKCSRLDAEWVQAALAPSKSKGDAAILTHTV